MADNNDDARAKAKEKAEARKEQRMAERRAKSDAENAPKDLKDHETADRAKSARERRGYKDHKLYERKHGVDYDRKARKSDRR